MRRRGTVILLLHIVVAAIFGAECGVAFASVLSDLADRVASRYPSRSDVTVRTNTIQGPVVGVLQHRISHPPVHANHPDASRQLSAPQDFPNGSIVLALRMIGTSPGKHLCCRKLKAVLANLAGVLSTGQRHRVSLRITRTAHVDGRPRPFVNRPANRRPECRSPNRQSVRGSSNRLTRNRPVHGAAVAGVSTVLRVGLGRQSQRERRREYRAFIHKFH